MSICYSAPSALFVYTNTMPWLVVGLSLFFILLCFAALATLIRDSLVTDAPFVPTRGGAIREIIKALDLHADSVLYDLGCGDARILREAMQAHPNIHGVGIEKGYLPYFVAKWRTRGLPIDIKREDIFTADISGATHIYCYLFQKVLAELEPKIIKECKPGTHIVTTDFTFPHLKLLKTVPLDTGKNHLARTLYVYMV